MVEPWTRAGFTTIIVDIQNEDSNPNATYSLSVDLTDLSELYEVLDSVGKPLIVFGFPPCTDLAVSGARWFADKAAIDPLFQDKAVSLARKVEEVGTKYNIPWMLENPVSVLASKWRKPDFFFHPYEYGGYLPEDDIHPMYPEYIAARDAYSKKTCIWCGNGFEMPEKRPVVTPEGYSDQYKKLGGKSIKTKNIRSATPRGYAQAVFEKYKEGLAESA